MIMMGLKLMGDVPFKEIYIHGLVRDADGNKMSKSKGNILDPLDLIDGIGLEQLVTKRTSGLMQPELAPRIEAATRRHFPSGIPAYGTDSLRFTFCSLATTGRDIRFDLGRIEGYRNFCNKLWNAARFVLLNTEGKHCDLASHEVTQSVADRWITSRLQETKAEVQNAIEQFRFDHVAQALYEFIWSEYCDWYIELSKPVLTNDNSAESLARSARRTLVSILEETLRLAHPLIPFITEEIWQRIAPLADRKANTIMLQTYPERDEAKVDHEADKEMAWIKAFVLGIRQIRGEMDISPAKRIPVLLQHGSDQDHRFTKTHYPYLEALARLESIDWLDETDTAPECATALVNELKLLVPMSGFIDKEAEILRLERELDRKKRDLYRSETKLANENFVGRAPTPVVEKERDRVEHLNATIANLEEQLLRLNAF